MGKWTKGLLKARGRFVDALGSVDTYDGPVSSSIIVCEETSATDGDGRVWTTSGRPEANAERLVACWNAMLGITDPAATMKEVREVLGKLAAVKIERAVPEVEATDPWPGSRVLFGYDGWELTVGDVRHARAILAKMEGK